MEKTTTKLQEMRISRGLTQRELADKCSISLGVLRHYEIGSRSLDGAKLSTLIDLANALECNLWDILEDKKNILYLQKLAK